MHAFWDHVILPLLDAAKGRSLLEVGAEFGVTTEALAEWASQNDAELDSIEPEPRFNPEELQSRFPGVLRMHRGLSLDELPSLGPTDVALIDGDHNWYTVHAELRALGRSAAYARLPMPLVIAHDTAWPYGRRDMYYDPATVPSDGRHPMAQAAIMPGRDELGETGVNGELWNAEHEGGPRNGVLTAIEDFAREQRPRCELARIGGWYGLTVLASVDRLDANPDLGAEFSRLQSPLFLSEQLDLIEHDRIVAEIARVRVERELAEATARAQHLERLLEQADAAEPAHPAG